jgi:hypothetical protein
VKNRFQSLPFKCNLQRYNEVLMIKKSAVKKKLTPEEAKVGLYKFNPVDPWLERAWLQPLSL